MFKNELKERLQNDIQVLLEKHSREITKEHIGDALNIMKDIDIALCQLKKATDMEDKEFTSKDRYNQLLNDYVELMLENAKIKSDDGIEYDSKIIEKINSYGVKIRFMPQGVQWILP